MDNYLFEIPSELLKGICYHLDPKDLVSLYKFYPKIEKLCDKYFFQSYYNQRGIPIDDFVDSFFDCISETIKALADYEISTIYVDLLENYKIIKFLYCNINLLKIYFELSPEILNKYVNKDEIDYVDEREMNLTYDKFSKKYCINYEYFDDMNLISLKGYTKEKIVQCFYQYIHENREYTIGDDRED